MNTLYRMIDANLNRANEGLRVLEDVARFVLDDRHLSQQLKACRHQIRAYLDHSGIDRSRVLQSRNTIDDVGTQITLPSEQERTGLPDLVSAASKRAQEALRVIEETSKALDLDGRSIEQMRYALYDIERELIFRLNKPTHNWPVCVLLTKSLCLHHSAQHIVTEVARAGIGCIQIREKEMHSNELVSYANEIVLQSHDLGMQCIINDRVDIAYALNADGVHLGQNDLSIADARSILGQTKIIGRSCSSICQLKDAFEQGADYCGIGPVFESKTKSKPNLIGLETLCRVMEDDELQSRHMLAISGINRETINAVSQTRIPGVALSSVVCQSRDPYQVCTKIIESHCSDSSHTFS